MKSSLTWGIVFLVAFGWLAVPTVHVRAVTTVRWTGMGDHTTWGSKTNWDPQKIPADGDKVIIEQAPGGPSHVTGVTTTHLLSLDLGPGTGVSIDTVGSAALTVDTLNWQSGAIYMDVIVTQAMVIQGSDQKELNNSLGGATLTLLGDSVLGGDGRFLSNSTIYNHGTMGVFPGSDFLLSGGTLDNYGQVSADLGLRLRIENTIIEDRATGQLGPGHVELTAAILHARASSHLAGRVDLANLASMNADGAVIFRPGTVLTQLPGSTFNGTAPDFKVSSGTAAFHWQGGELDQGPIFRNGLSVDISGGSLKTLSNAGRAALKIDPGVQVFHHNGGALRLVNTSAIDNSGKWIVPAGDDARIEGGSCCANPAQFRNHGTVEIFPQRTLTVANMRLINVTANIVGVPGQARGALTFEGGSNVLGTGTNIDNVDVTFSNGVLELSGTVTLAQRAALTQTQRSDLNGTAILTGAGQYTWLGGTIYGRPTFDTGVALDIEPDPVPPDRHELNGTFGGGVIVAEGPTIVNDDVLLDSVGANRAGIDNRGSMRWIGGDGIGSNGFLTNRMILTVDPGNVPVTLSQMDVLNTGTLMLQSGILDITRQYVQTAGSTRLVGGVLRPEAGFAIRGGKLRGPGKVDGDVRNTGGIVDMGTGAIGRIVVGGTYTQGAGGRLRLRVKNTGSATGFDRLVASGSLSLAGGLIIARSGNVTLPARTVVLVSGTSRTGMFGSVSGLSTLGAGWHVQYGPANVKLKK